MLPSSSSNVVQSVCKTNAKPLMFDQPKMIPFAKLMREIYNPPLPGGLGVPSSNLGAPTSYMLEATIYRKFLHSLDI